MFRMSAKSELTEPQVCGPTVFRKDKDVEYTIFLTYDIDRAHGPLLCRCVLKQLLEQIMIVLEKLKMDVVKLSLDVDEIIENIINDPKMFTDH
jgi:hypothetical protein